MNKPLKRIKGLQMRGISDVSVLKEQIQDLLRQIVMKRDRGCLLRKIRNCNDPVKQADHLITRSNSATYADSRLVVCLCRSCHGWKKWNKEEYDYLIEQLISKERVKLWKKMQKESWMPKRVGLYDWKLHIVYLKQEAKQYGIQI